MANRYLIQGITEDVRAGKRVGLLSPYRSDALRTFDAIVTGLDERETQKLSATRGRERLQHVSNGTLELIRDPAQFGRGARLDVLVVTDWNVLTTTARDNLQYDARGQDIELVRL